MAEVMARGIEPKRSNINHSATEDARLSQLLKGYIASAVSLPRGANLQATIVFNDLTAGAFVLHLTSL